MATPAVRLNPGANDRLADLLPRWHARRSRVSSGAETPKGREKVRRRGRAERPSLMSLIRCPVTLKKPRTVLSRTGLDILVMWPDMITRC
jgi:hypothetical protein